MLKVKVSAKSMRQPFHGCDPDYIKNVCHGRCCESSVNPRGIMVTIHASERHMIEAAGGRVDSDGFLHAENKRCPFKTNDDLCGLHGTGSNQTTEIGNQQPFGCRASPFTLNKNDTLIVRNRYRLLKCYKDGDAPAYIAFKTSLIMLFGAIQYKKMAAHLDEGGADIYLDMDVDIHEKLQTNDEAKRLAQKRAS